MLPEKQEEKRLKQAIPPQAEEAVSKKKEAKSGDHVTSCEVK